MEQDAKIECSFTQIAIFPNGRASALLRHKKKTVSVPLAPYEVPMVNFVYHDTIANNTHIHTIYQMYLGLLRDTGTILKSATIDAVHGDMIYATLQFQTASGAFFYSKCSPADALILVKLSKCPLCAMQKAFDALEEFDHEALA